MCPPTVRAAAERLFQFLSIVEGACQYLGRVSLFEALPGSLGDADPDERKTVGSCMVFSSARGFFRWIGVMMAFGRCRSGYLGDGASRTFFFFYMFSVFQIGCNAFIVTCVTDRGKDCSSQSRVKGQSTSRSNNSEVHMIKIIRFSYLCLRRNATTKPSSSQDPAKHAEIAMVSSQLMQGQVLL